jgi:hypothetical protein
MQAKILNWTDIIKKHPDEWVVLANPVFEGMRLKEGVILTHHSDKRVASMESAELRAGFEKFTLVYTGVIPANRHIGLLKKVSNAK